MTLCLALTTVVVIKWHVISIQMITWILYIIITNNSKPKIKKGNMFLFAWILISMAVFKKKKYKQQAKESGIYNAKYFVYITNDK